MAKNIVIHVRCRQVGETITDLRSLWALFRSVHYSVHQVDLQHSHVIVVEEHHLLEIT